MSEPDSETDAPQRITHALSIREPYAWLIAAGFKLAEIRSFPFPKKFTEPTWIAIHASLSRDELNDLDLEDYLLDLDAELAGIWNHEKWLEEGNRLFACSEIIGAMRVNRSLQWDLEDDDAPEWEQWADIAVRRSSRCQTGVNPGEFLDDEQHNWIIDDVYRFHRPIVCLGRLNVWSLGDKLEALANEEFHCAIRTGGLDRSEPLGKPHVHQMPKTADRKVFGLDSE